MVIVSFILIGTLLIVLQSTVFMPGPVWLAAPDFYYVLIAYMAFRFDLVRSLVILFPLGCVLDVVSGTILGMHSLLCFSSFFLLRLLSRRLPINEYIYQIPLVSLSYLAVFWGAHFFLGFFDSWEALPWSWWRIVVRALLVAALTYPLFLGFGLLEKALQRRSFPWKRLRIRADNRRRRAA